MRPAAVRHRAEAAQLLREAERRTAPVEPLSMTWPALDLADAYAVQQDNITCRLVTGATVIGHPATAVAWPASTLAAYGAALDAEHVILPGAMATAPLIGAGQKAEARFGPLGSVSVSFV